MMLHDPGARMTPWLEAAWLQRYLERRLDAEETAWFEAYLMDKPELIDRLEADSDLRDGLFGARAVAPRVDQTSAMRPADASPKAPQSPAAIERRDVRSRRRITRNLALAATLVAGVAVGWLSQSAQGPGDEPVLIANPKRVVYDVMRDGARPPHIENEGSQSYYELIEVAVPPGASNITLTSQDSPGETLTASPDGFVSFLAKKQRGAARHRLVVSYFLQGEANSHEILLEQTEGGK